MIWYENKPAEIVDNLEVRKPQIRKILELVPLLRIC
jgi:hypothetical protein